MMRVVCQTKHPAQKLTTLDAVAWLLGNQNNAAVNIAARFGENLVRCRKAADLSQEELGSRASLHRTEIGQLERGLRLARIDTVVKLAGALAIAPGDLLEGMSWTPGITTSGEFAVSPAEAGGAVGAQAGPSLAPTSSA